MGGFPGDVSTKLLFIAALMVSITFAVVQLVSSSSSSLYSAVTYKVGDDVIQWSSSSNRTFHVDDTISFEYDHNELYQHVVQVTPTAYQLCDATSPIAVFTTGNDSITFNNTGHYYFIFGPASTCVQEQMLDIYVQSEEDDDDQVSVAPIQAPASVSLSSSAAATSTATTSTATVAAAASSKPNSSCDDSSNYFTLWSLVFILGVPASSFFLYLLGS